MLRPPCGNIHTNIHVNTHKHICMYLQDKLISHTPWACTLTPVTTSVTFPLHKGQCAVLTHTSAYSTWPPVTSCLSGRNLDMYNSESCSDGANGQGLTNVLLQMRFQLFWFNASVPSFVPTEHDSGWTPVLIRTRGLSVKTMNKAPLVSPSVFIYFLWTLLCWFVVLLILLAFLGTTSAPDYKSFGDPTSG